MNTLRTIVIFAVLGAVGFGVYATLNRRPPPDPPEGLPEGWDSNPAVQFGEVAGPQLLEGMPGSPPAVSAPSSAQSAAPTAPGVDAPPFASISSPGTAPDTPPFGAAPPVPMPADLTAAPISAFPQGADGASPITPEFAASEPQLPGTSFDSAPRLPPSGFASPAPLPNDTAANNSAGMTDAAPFGQTPGANSNPQGATPLGTSPSAAPPPSAATSPPTEATPVSASPANQPAPYTASASNPQPTTGDFVSSWSLVQQALAQDRLVDAHRELSRWYGSPQLTAQDQQSVQFLLDQLAGTIIYSRESILEPPYDVQPGDNLERIAERYGVPWQLLHKINGVTNPQALQPGEKLKVVRGPFSADVNLSKFRLTLWLGDLYAGNFPIGIGNESANTPDGDFSVQDKLENPTYYGEQVIAADDPTNPLGEHWISLGNHIGIHGTIEPQTIGQAASNGCIRLTERDITDVYDILSTGSRVIIRR